MPGNCISVKFATFKAYESEFRRAFDSFDGTGNNVVDSGSEYDVIGEVDIRDERADGFSEVASEFVKGSVFIGSKKFDIFFEFFVKLGGFDDSHNFNLLQSFSKLHQLILVESFLTYGNILFHLFDDSVAHRGKCDGDLIYEPLVKLDVEEGEFSVGERVELLVE
jgi:hypothetical protein